MRVLLVLDSLAPGGAERSTVGMMPALLERGVVPEVAVLHDRPGLKDEVTAIGVPVHLVTSIGQGRIGWVRGLHQLMGERQPDLIHTCLFEADVCGRTAAAWRRMPVVSTLPSELYGPGHRTDPALSGWKVRVSQGMDGATARWARRLHAVSTHVADTMATRLHYPRRRIDVIPRGRPAGLAAVDPVDRLSLRRSLGIGPDQPVLLVVARQEWAKGIDRAIEALPALTGEFPGIQLLVAGAAGEHTAELQATVERLGVPGATRFLGYREDVATLLGISDVFLLLSRREGLPGALLEAMAAGTPAVVNDLPQIREVAGPDVAQVIDAGRPEQVASAVRAVLADPAAAQRRADGARDRFLAIFTLDRVADDMVAFYQRALAGTAPL